MLRKSLFLATLLPGLALASVAQAGHSDPQVRLGVDVIWGGGYIRPAPVVWYPAPVYSYAPPPAYGQPYWAGGHSHQRHQRHRHHRHKHHHDRRDRRDRRDRKRHDD